MKQKGTDYSKILIWAAALVGVVRYSAAFIESDMGQITGDLSLAISFLMGLSGLGMGLLDTVGGAYLFDGWRRAMPKNGQAWPFRFKALTVFVGLIFATGLGILVPFTVARVSHLTMKDTLGTGGLWLWGIAVNLAPLLLIGGVSTGQQVVAVSSENTAESGRKVSDDEPESTRKVSDDGQEVAGNFPGDWRKARIFMSDEEVAEIAEMDTARLVLKYHLPKDGRKARDWRKYAQAEVAARKVEAG